jgi:hypothetical protein
LFHEAPRPLLILNQPRTIATDLETDRDAIARKDVEHGAGRYFESNRQTSMLVGDVANFDVMKPTARPVMRSVTSMLLSGRLSKARKRKSQHWQFLSLEQSKLADETAIERRRQAVNLWGRSAP